MALRAEPERARLHGAAMAGDGSVAGVHMQGTCRRRFWAPAGVGEARAAAGVVVCISSTPNRAMVSVFWAERRRPSCMDTRLRRPVEGFCSTRPYSFQNIFIIQYH